MHPRDRLLHAFSPENRQRLKVIQEIRETLLKELCGGLWHTTLLDRYELILSTGSISPDPDIPDSERWSTSQGKEFYPYVRQLGGVSLFDFANFDPNAYAERCPNSTWRAFIPFLEQSDHAVWIEINRERLQQFIPGEELLKMWKAEVGRAPLLMPYIEAANRGPVPTTAFKRALLVREAEPNFTSLGCF
jgi:hypothetical protein